MVAGAAYIYTRSGTSWSRLAYLKASNTDGADHFGSSMGLSGDGSTLASATNSEDSSATRIGGDQTNNGADLAGAVYVF